MRSRPFAEASAGFGSGIGLKVKLMRRRQPATPEAYPQELDDLLTSAKRRGLPLQAPAARNSPGSKNS